MSQQISLIGQVATEPKLFSPEGGVQFCTFRMACTERRFDSQKGEWVDAETNWFTINAFRMLAAHAKESFTKGDRVIVSGRLRVRNWEKDEKRGTSVEIDIDGIGHDVRWGVSSFAKRIGAGAAGDAPADGEVINGDSDNSGTADGSAVSSTGVSSAAASSQDSVPDAFAGIETSELSGDGFTPNVAAA